MNKLINMTFILFLLAGISHAHDLIIKPEKAVIKYGDSITYSMVITKGTIFPLYFYDGDKTVHLESKKNDNNIYQWRYKPKKNGVLTPVIVYNDGGQHKNYMLEIQVKKKTMFDWSILYSVLSLFFVIGLVLWIKEVYFRTMRRRREVAIAICVINKLLVDLEELSKNSSNIKYKISLLPRWCQDLYSIFWRPTTYSVAWAELYYDLNVIINCLKLQQNKKAEDLIKDFRNKLDKIEMPKFWSSLFDGIRQFRY